MPGCTMQDNTTRESTARESTTWGYMTLGGLLLLLAASTARGQEVDPLPPVLPPVKRTAEQVKARESLYQYALALLCMKEDRLLEGLKALEEAAKLNPNAAPVYRELVNVQVALERVPDAIASLEKALELEPDDSEAWFLAGRLYKSVGRMKENQKALEKGLADVNLPAERPEIAQQMWLDLAQLLETDEDLVGATKALSEAAAILDHPDQLADRGPYQREKIVARAADTYERLGDLYRRQKKYAEAVDAYDKAQKRAPQSASRIHFHLAQLSREQGKHADALAHVDRYLRTVPLGVQGHEFKIDVLTRLDRTAEILPWLEQAALVDVHNIPLRHLLARTSLKLGKRQQAEEVYHRLAIDAPSEEVYKPLFQLYRQRPKGVAEIYTIVQKTVEKAKKKPPEPGTTLAAQQAQAMVNVLREDGVLARELVSHVFGLARRDVGISYDSLRLFAALAEKHRQFEESERFYKSLLEDPVQRLEPLVFGGYLRALWRNGKFEEIIRVCDNCLANENLVTNRLMFTSEKAKALASLERHDEALKMADESIKTAQDDNLFYAYNLRIRTLVSAQKYDQAERETQELFKKFTTLEQELDIRQLLASVYHAANKRKESEDQLLEILKVDPNNAGANNDLGYYWAEQNRNLKEAEAMIRKAIEHDRQHRKLMVSDQPEENAAYLDSLAWVLFRKGEIEEARKLLEKATSLPEGDDPVLFDHLGDVYYRLGLTMPAQEAWEKSLELFDKDRRRRKDDRYREIQEKLRVVKTPRKAVGN